MTERRRHQVAPVPVGQEQQEGTVCLDPTTSSYYSLEPPGPTRLREVHQVLVLVTLVLAVLWKTCWNRSGQQQQEEERQEDDDDDEHDDQKEVDDGTSSNGHEGDDGPVDADEEREPGYVLLPPH